MKKVMSYILGLSVGLLVVAPPIGYSISVMVNSYSWLYLLVASGLLGMYLLSTDLPKLLKIFIPFVFVSCFISQAPYASFNAFICMVIAMYAFWAFLRSDYKSIVNMVVAAFWVEFILIGMQLLGRDTLLCFGSTDKVFLGSVMQYMRVSSLLAIMAPILVLKNKWYIIPIFFLCIVSKSSSFGLAVVTGTAVYFGLTNRKHLLLVIVLFFAAGLGYFIWDNGSFQTAFTCGRIPVWGDVIKTWCFDTSKCIIPVSKNFIHCPIDWKSIFIGRGLDTFLPLFPIFKHDWNPFPQAHNDFLQIVWELGLIGGTLLLAYYTRLMYRLKNNPILVAGLVCMGVNMFFAFPTRQTQCMLMMIAYVAYCEQTARRIKYDC